MTQAHRIFRNAGLTLAGLTFASLARAQDSAEPMASPPGPAPSYTPAPPPQTPPPVVGATPGQRGARAEVRFEPDDPGVQLLTLSGAMPFEQIGYVHHGWWRPHGYYYGYGVAPVYSPLCEGTCSLQLMPGPYHLALAQSGGTIVPVEGPTLIGGPSTIHAQYVDRSGLRTTGVVVGVVGAVAGIIMIIDSYHDHYECDAYGDCYEHSDVNGPLVAGGIGVLVGSAIVSAVLISQRDEAKISVTPLRLLSMGTRRESGFLPPSLRTQPEGAMVSIPF